MFSASILKLNWMKSPWIAAAAITLSGTHINNLDSRGIARRAFTVSLPRMSPALAALEDSVKTWSASPTATLAAVHQVQLKSGVSAIFSMQRIMREPTIDQKQLQQWLTRIPLGGRIQIPIAKVVPVVTPVTPVATSLKGMTIRRLPDPIQPTETLQTVTVANVNLSQFQTPTPETLTPREKDHLVAQLSSQNWSQPTFEARAKELVEKENAKGPAPTDQPVQLRNGILVASQTVNRPSSTTPPPSSSSPLPRPPEPQAGISWAKPDDGVSVRATLSGAIRLAGGLAVTDPAEKIVIFREWEGLSVEKGQVWMNDGRFEISTGALRGRLLAQLRDGRGQVLGEGEIKLNQITLPQDSDRIADLMMTLRPVFDGVRVEVTSAHSYGENVITVPHSKVWMMGEAQPLKTDETHHYFSDGGLKRGSSYVAQATADNHWGTIVVGLVGQESRALLFPNKLMGALFNLTQGQNISGAVRSGVIWGRITKGGIPLAGAQVEMAADHRQQAHYFNALLIPDRMAEATGENGTFALVDVTPGIQSVRVVYQGKAWPAQIVPVERNHVSYLDFELGSPESVPLEIFDPLDGGKELNGILRWAGDETSEIEIQGRGRLGVPSGPGVVMLEADAGEPYELMRYTIQRNAKRIQLPVVRRDWLASLAARKRINQDAGVGIAVGFGLPEDFTVDLDRPEDSGSTPEIVYFSPQGQAMFTDEGVAGGGFIVFNVTPGLRTLTLASKSDRKLFRQVILSSPDAVNLILTDPN